VITRSQTRNRCGGQQPFLLQERERGGGRKPGQPVALTRVSGVSPAIHSRESPAAAGSSAIIRQSQEPHVSLSTISSTSPGLATQKPPAVVQKLWTTRLPCGRTRKS